MGKEWSSLDSEIKKKYQQEFTKAKAKYDRDMEEYMRMHPDYVEPKRRKKQDPQPENSEGDDAEGESSGMPAPARNGHRE